MVSVWPQWWQPVGGPRDTIWDLRPWYGQFEVGWLQPLQLWLGAGTSLVAPVLVSQDRDLCHVQLHRTWFEPTSECRSWPVVSYTRSVIGDSAGAFHGTTQCQASKTPASKSPCWVCGVALIASARTEMLTPNTALHGPSRALNVQWRGTVLAIFGYMFVILERIANGTHIHQYLHICNLSSLPV